MCGGDPIKLEDEGLINSDSPKDDKLNINKIREKKNFLIIYVVSLLAIALALVLMSYLNEIRMRRTEVAGLRAEKEQTAISAMQSIQNLEEENQMLKEQLEAIQTEKMLLEDQITELEQLNIETEVQNTKYWSEAENAAQTVEKLKLQQNALDALTNISELYTGKKYSYAAYKISVLEEGDSQYVTKLFAETEHGPGFSNLISNYNNMRTWLENKGYMDPDKIAKWKEKNISE